MIKQRALARDRRNDRVGEVMAEASTPGARGKYWLRPVGGGIEWEVTRKDLQLLDEQGESKGEPA